MAYYEDEYWARQSYHWTNDNVDHLYKRIAELEAKLVDQQSKYEDLVIDLTFYKTRLEDLRQYVRKTT